MRRGLGRVVAELPGATLFRRPPLAGLAVCLVFAAVGVAVFGDYGVSVDERARRAMAVRAADYVLGKNADMMHHFDRVQGVAFELPLYVAESVLGLEDVRDVHLLRHLLSHLFFLAGGFFCGLLAHRLTGSRAAAVLAALMFLLHPRLYAHSFFNSRDVPFAAMFVIALYCAWRAFDKGTWRAFALAGAAAGALVSMRSMGVIVIGGVAALQLCDMASARAARDRKRVLLACGAFAFACAAALYATWPYLWADPLGRLAESFSVAANHPNRLWELFRGQRVFSHDLPRDYLPVWFAVTTPPVFLAFGLLGTVVVAARCALRPRRALRNGRLRFLLLAAACFAGPVVAVIVLEPRLFNGWRHLYFVHGPFAALAAAGAHWAASSVRARGAKTGVYCVAGAGVLWTIVAMARLHPYEHLYFNALADKDGPERLAEQYELDYWSMSYREGLEFLLSRYPNRRIRVDGGDHVVTQNWEILRPEQRERLVIGEGADFAAIVYRDRGRSDWRPVFGPVVHSRKVYESTIMEVAVVALPEDGGAAEPYRQAYESVAGGAPAARGAYDVYAVPNGLAYVKKPCARADTRGHVILHAVPADARDLPPGRQLHGYVQRHYPFGRYGVRFGDTCLVQVPVMDFPLDAVRTGQRLLGDGQGVGRPDGPWIWDATVDVRAAQGVAAPGPP